MQLIFFFIILCNYNSDNLSGNGKLKTVIHKIMRLIGYISSLLPIYDCNYKVIMF